MILSIINQKGGVGKTTTAVTLGHGLAREGRRVLVVDLDAQGNVADALGLKKWSGLQQLLTGGEQAITASGRENLDVILGDKSTVEAKISLIGRPFRERILRDSLSPFVGRYELVILDVAPGIDLLQVGALVASTAFLIPVALDHLAVVGAGDALASMVSLQEMGGLGGRCLGLLPTMWDRVTNESHEQLQVLSQMYAKWVWPPIPDDVKAREAPGRGLTLWEYAPKCRALRGVELGGTGLIGGYAAACARLGREIDDSR